MDIVKDSILQAGVFTFLILVIGVLVGLQMDDLRQGHVQNNLDQSNLDTETFMVLQDYVEGSGENFCELSEARLPDVGQKNAELGAELERFDSQEFADEERYDYIRDRYYNNQLRLYMLINEYNVECENSEDTILYFFDDSTDSQRQGAVLDEIGSNRQAMIFAFNIEAMEESPIVEILVKDHDITQTPSIVVNREEKFEGFVSQGELEHDILPNQSQTN